MEWLVLGIFIILLWHFILGPLFGNVGGFFTGIRQGYQAPLTKKCPMCFEIIKTEAKKCKHCGHLF